MFEWERSAFVASPENVPVTLVPDYIKTIFIQIAWGTGLPNPPISPERLVILRSYFKIGVWAWCQGENVAAEAEWHANVALQVNAEAFVANMEEPYDAHGDSGNIKFGKPKKYLKVLKQKIGAMPLGVTTTPLFGSDMTDWINDGAICMPQAFPKENFVTITNAVKHAKAWGWPTSQIRPLVQTYPTRNEWPNAVEMNIEATDLGIGVIPYTIEQAVPSAEGNAVLKALSDSIQRPNPEEEIDPVAKMIGDQHGITAAYNRMKKLDPEGCNPKFDPNHYDALPIDQLKAWDKWARTLMILREDHDDEADTWT